MDEVLTVYDFDAGLADNLKRNVEHAFAELRPPATPQLPAVGAPVDAPDGPPTTADAGSSLPQQPPSEAERRKLLEDKLGIRVSRGAFQALEKEGFSKELAERINGIMSEVLVNGVVTNKDILLKEGEKGVVLRDVGTQEEKIVHNLNRFYGLDQAKTMARILGQPLQRDLDYGLVNLTVDIVQGIIQPNITLNRNETQERKTEAAAAIEPVRHKIKAGEMLLREGERVTDLQLLKLQTLEALTEKEQALASVVGATLLMVSLILSSYFLHLVQPGRLASDRNKHLLLLASLFLVFALLAQLSFHFADLVTQSFPYPIPEDALIYGIPVAAGAMIVCLFLGLQVALSFALVAAVACGLIFHNSLQALIYFLVNGSMAAYWIRNCRERRVFISAGLKIGLINILLAAAIDIYAGDWTGGGVLWKTALAFWGGIAAGIVAAGIAPLVEVAFGYTTDISLLELANLDRPILRRLMIEAPGTYHHSVIVGTLVEAAATEIGANPLLAKVCGYYHDIGKIKKPLYFIENQRDGKNKHDKLAPSMSSLILIAHVKDGVEIARENKLGETIIDTIRQHHGTSLIQYFYEKAKQLKGADAVDIDNFRYPGPRPQTREAGLVMLADVVEAASRTLENPTTSRINGLVQNLINKIFSDGQLDECELTLKDLHKIAGRFNKILYGIHHHRIEYSDRRTAGGDAKGKTPDGSSHRQPAKDTSGKSEADQAGSKSRLKRLGLS
jgi:putative nucleotidyltransferase with HDIG domain